MSLAPVIKFDPDLDAEVQISTDDHDRFVVTFGAPNPTEDHDGRSWLPLVVGLRAAAMRAREQDPQTAAGPMRVDTIELPYGVEAYIDLDLPDDHTILVVGGKKVRLAGNQARALADQLLRNVGSDVESVRSQLIELWDEHRDRPAAVEALIRIDERIAELADTRESLYSELIAADQATLNIEYRWCDICQKLQRPGPGCS